MPRRPLAPLAAFAAILAVLAAACSSAPAAPQLSDPKEILTRSVENLQNLKTVHFKADISGQVKLDLGGGSGSGSIDLKGTTAEGDLDMAGSKLRATASAPLLLGLTMDMVVIDQTTYIRTSVSGDKYQKTTSSPGPSASGLPTDPKQAIADLKTELDKLPNAPKKLGDEKVNGTDCYHVQVAIPASDVTDALAAASMSPAGVGDATLDVWVAKDSLRPAKLAVQGGSADTGTLSVAITFSAYDQSVNISAPPADQIQTVS